MSTLRETLNRLASEGFVDALDQRGFFVTPISKEDLIEVANLRVYSNATPSNYRLIMVIQTGKVIGFSHHKLSSMEQKMLVVMTAKRKIGKDTIGNFISLLSKRVVPEI